MIREKAKDLLDWAEEHIQLLELIRNDLAILEEPSNKAVIFAIDYYDIHGFAYPLTSSKKFRLDDIFRRPNARTEAAKEQAARCAMFFGMPAQQYPMLILPPHYLELYHSTFLAIANAPSEFPFMNQLINMLKEEISEIELTKSRVLSKQARKYKDRIFELLIESSPELIISLSGIHTQAVKVIKALFHYEKISADPQRCGLPENMLTQDSKKVPDIDYWFKLYKKARPGWDWLLSNKRDATALATVKWMNDRLAKSRYVIYFVSSAQATHNVLSSAGQDAYIDVSLGSDEWRTSFHRHRDYFRIIYRYMKEVDHSSSTSKFPLLKDVAPLINDDIGKLSPLVDAKAEIKSAIVRVQKGTPLKGILGTQYSKFLEQAEEVRNRLLKTHLLADANSMLTEYDLSNAVFFNSHSDDDALDFVESIKTKLIKLLSSESDYEHYVIKQISHLKITLASEFQGLFVMSELIKRLPKSIDATTFSRVSSKWTNTLGEFQAFPYRVQIEDEELKKRLTKIQQLARENKGVETFARFLRELNELTKKCANVINWGDSDTRTVSSRPNIDKMLVWLALLIALREYKRVINYASNCEKLAIEIKSKSASEFLLVANFARLCNSIDGDNVDVVEFNKALGYLGITEPTVEDLSEESDLRCWHFGALAVARAIKRGINFRKQAFTLRWSIQVWERISSLLEDLNVSQKYGADFKDTVLNNLSYNLLFLNTGSDPYLALATHDKIVAEEDAWHAGFFHTRAAILIRLAELEQNANYASEVIRLCGCGRKMWITDSLRREFDKVKNDLDRVIKSIEEIGSPKNLESN